MIETLHRVRTHRLSPLLLVGFTATFGTAGVASGLGWLTQWFGALAVLPILLADLAAADHRRAFGHMLAWAAGLALVGAACGLWLPAALPRLWTDAAWLHDDTLAFLARGEGLLARPTDYTPDHVLDYLYVSTGAAFGAVAPLLWGTRQILLVSGEWGALVRSSASLAVLAAGLPPWSLLGALGYAGLLTGWGEVPGAVLSRRAVQWRVVRRWVAASTGTLVLHWATKALMAPVWRDWIW